MTDLAYLFAFLSAFFLVLCAFLAFKLRKKPPTQTITVDAKDLLHSILSGTAILKISVIDPGDILIRSPRG